MNKSENSLKSDSNSAKKSPTNFFHKTVKLVTSAFVKTPNESWD